MITNNVHITAQSVTSIKPPLITLPIMTLGLSDGESAIRRQDISPFHNESKQSIRILATSGGAAFIANNYIVTEAATPILTTAGTQIVSG